MNIIQTFIDWLPFSLLIFIIPVLIYWLLKPSGSEKEIKNRVEVFFKGGTKAYYDCTVNNDMVQFIINETEYNEPIVQKPRIELNKGDIYRTYLFAEGVTGTIEVPPLSDEKRKEIVEILKSRMIISPKDKREEFTDDELREFVTFYNFDVDGITDNSQTKMFGVGMNATGHLINAIIRGINRDSQEGSNFRTFLILLVGAIMGFFMGYALTLKGVI